MIKPLLRQKEKELVAKPKAIIPLCSLAGAVIGVSVVLLLSIFMERRNILVWIILEAPGMVAFREINMLTDIKSSMSRDLYYDVFANFIIYGTSSIPPAMIGWMIGSNAKWMITAGITLLVLYIPISIVAGITIYAMSM